METAFSASMGTEVEVSEPLIEKITAEEDQLIPEWKDQITIRGLAVSAIMGTLFCIITHRLNLTVGIIPSLNIAAGLLGFLSVKSWTSFLSKLGFSTKPFTRQENTVIQTCVVACYGLAASGGFGSSFLAMDKRTYKLIGTEYPGNRAEDVKNPGLGWMIVFMFVVSFVGLFSLVALRKVMILDGKLTYPSGTATAVLINGFHTNAGAELAGMQVRFYFDFSPTYVGCGLICPRIVNCSVLLGAIVSWGFLWPYISQHAGDWYPADLGNSDFKGLYGYKVFIAISLILGDGLYNLIKIISVTFKELCNKRTKVSKLPIDNEIQGANEYTESSRLLIDQKKRENVFLKDGIPTWFAASGYVGLAAISTATIPTIFPPLKWYLVLLLYLIAPALAFCNSYGAGLTDCSLSLTYAKIGLFIIASLVGTNGGVIAGLAACGVMMSIVSTAADLMQDFKTGYLTLSSAKSMFVSQLLGTAMGCVFAPLTFWMYWTAFDIGSPDGPYKAPYAVILREMAILGIEGFSELPKHCLALCCGFFVAALVINLLRDVIPEKISKFIPVPMAMAIPFFVGAYLAIDMFVGTVILFIWERINRKDSEDYAGAVASGLICGDGIWTMPSAVLSIFSINPPICMYFGPTIVKTFEDLKGSTYKVTYIPISLMKPQQ
ncbi:putative metal-nicotianamine transporter YSL6 [Citrus sinensis]|uniref:Metal-nicotianamine transporter YSL6 n=1 Tax=Citrus sinensis TaxID=2711 RepID=A0ACB8IGF6_CITSI|nr:putative metal-nicotianamine transporter YSL6 [Citrus sinensis]